MRIFLIAWAVWESVKLVCLFITPFVTEMKNRTVVGWFFFVFLFGILPFIILCAMPEYKPPKRYYRNIEY